jgi:hypothetical protein
MNEAGIMDGGQAREPAPRRNWMTVGGEGMQLIFSLLDSSARGVVGGLAVGGGVGDKGAVDLVIASKAGTGFGVE